METNNQKTQPRELEPKTKTPNKIQIVKFAIGIVIGISIYLIVKLIF